MTDRPILFSPPMISALLAGTKVQTRRVIKPRGLACLFDGSWTDNYVMDPGNARWRERSYPYRIGDRLWVRETACIWGGEVFYKTNEPGVTVGLGGFGKWTPSIFMPRWASRLTLEVINVRVQRLQDITTADALVEGVGVGLVDGKITKPNTRQSFFELWDGLNAKRGYPVASNPWVVAVSFIVRRGNIDQVAP